MIALLYIKGHQTKYTKKSEEPRGVKREDKPPAVLNVMYGDIISSDEMPDSRPDATVSYSLHSTGHFM